MPLPSFSLARLLGLGVLWLGLVVGCGGGGGTTPPPESHVPPDAGRSSVSVDRATGVRADGAERVTVTVTVRDASGKPLSGKTVHVEVSGDGNTVTQPTGTTSASGVVTALVVSTQPGTRQVKASVDDEGGAVVITEQPSITFIAPPAVKLAFLTTNLSATAGEAVSPEVEVAIQDGLGRTVAGASAEVSLLLAAGPASAGVEGTLTAQAVNGIARFPRVVLKQAGTGYQLKATSSGLADASSPTFEVVPALPTSIVLVLPGSATAGTVMNAAVTIRDAFGNQATNYRGTVHLSSNAPGAMLPADYTLTEADQGSKTFSVTLSQVGNWQVQVEDSDTATLSTSASVTVLPGPATQFVLTSLPGPFEAGEEFSVEVRARDAFGNEATGYLGTIHVTATDPAAELPGDYTFTEADDGRHSFNVVLKTAATLQQVTVTDTAVASLTATLGREIVPAAPSQPRFVKQPGNVQVRATLPTVQVELADAFGNRSLVSTPPVSLTLKGGNPASVLSGTLSVDPVDGVATFSNLAVDQEGTGFQLTATAGVLPAVDSASFDVTDTVAPATVTLTSTGQTGTSVSLAWTAVGDDGNLGTAARYELRYSTGPITRQDEFNAATLATSGTPQAPGSAESFTVTGLNAATSYSFAVVVWDAAGNASALNPLQIATFNPCSGVVCEVPEPTCAADGVTRVTFTSACVLVDDLPTCQDTEQRSTCPGADGVCFAAACGTASRPEPGELLITEVMHSPSSNTTPYFELHNSTQKLLNLTGLHIENDWSGQTQSFTVNAPSAGGAVLIPLGGWFVVAQNGAFDTNGGVPVDYALGSSFQLGPTGHIRLRAESGSLIEDFSWSSSFPQTPGRSMSLSSFVADTQAHKQSWYWCDSSVDVKLLGGDSGTPGQPNETCGLAVASAPGYCNIQYPKAFPDAYDPAVYPAVIPYGSRKTIYSQVWTPGLTDLNGSGNDDSPLFQAELGYGVGVDPSTWQWTPARFNPFYDTTSPAFAPSNDELYGWLRILTPGTYAYGFRYRFYDPVTQSFSGYTYCDQNGMASPPTSGTYGTVTVGTDPLGPTQHVVISEFAPRGSNGVTVNEDDEFLELYNPTSVPVDISGWKVQYLSAEGSSFQDLVTVPQGTSIAAQGYYLMAHVGYAGSVAPDLSYSQALPSTGGNVRIGLGTLGAGIVDSSAVDNLGWGSAVAPEGDAAPVAEAAGSLERKAALQSTAGTMEGADAARGNGIDSDWNADDFVSRAIRGPQNSLSSPETP